MPIFFQTPCPDRRAHQGRQQEGQPLTETDAAVHPINGQTDDRQWQDERHAGGMGLPGRQSAPLQQGNGEDAASRPEKAVEQSDDHSAEKKNCAHLPIKKTSRLWVRVTQRRLVYAE